MDFKTAAEQYSLNSTAENLERLVGALVAEMSLKEKIYMLSGHTIGRHRLT